ncbi:MAG: 4a-hydroxytetrahydrobiopterin dehydratase [Patescibacteria group bacterium]
MSLSQKHCKPCEEGAKPLSRGEANKLGEEIGLWHIENNSKLERIFTFKDFKEALEFVNKVGEIAEREGHHPNITLFDYKKVKLELYTHSIGGLSENDFILASHINNI